MSRNLILTGFSGTGKSHVGRTIAQIQGCKFLDTDEEVVRISGKSIAEIFKHDGEAHFRHLESQAVVRACAASGVVVSTGGGAIIDPNNYRAMAASGVIVCLNAMPETILSRLQQPIKNSEVVELRPLLDTPNQIQKIKDLKTQRQGHYDLAECLVQTDGLTVQEVAREAINMWQKRNNDINNSTKAGNPSPAFLVEAPSATYPVFVDWDLLDNLGMHLLSAGINGPVYVITDSNVSELHGSRVDDGLKRAGIEVHNYTIPAGEASKTLTTAGDIYAWLAEQRCERGHAIIALGGGMVGDIVGFVAATFLRGVSVIQVPTSLAAMVDASIGGKTAVNLPAGKNLVGAFYQPRMVVADLSTLKSLAPRELASGWAEAIKHGLILDASLFDLFEERVESLLYLEPEVTSEVIRRSMAIKGKIVAEDEKETAGRRILLNYGHTIGHGLEAATGYTALLHGEAVSVGMVAAGAIAQQMGLISHEAVERYTAVLKGFGLPTSCPGVDPDSVVKAMEMDKKTTSKKINWVLLEDIGITTVCSDVPDDLMQQAVRNICNL